MSSRIIVKNLPKHYTEERFRSHFSTKGEITDARLIRNPQGIFRRFGYIGYRTEKEAKTAQRYFNNTFIDTSKIIVDIAKPYGDESLPRPWSVYTKGSTLYNKAHGVVTTPSAKKGQQNDQEPSDAKKRAIRSLYEELVAENQDDPRFKEFLQVMAPRASSKTWANDDDYGRWSASEVKVVERAAAARRAQVEGKSDGKAKTQVKVVPNKKPGGEGMVVTKTHMKFGDDNGAASDEDEGEDNEGETTKPSDNTLSDLDWLRAHMSSKADSDADAGSDGNSSSAEESNGSADAAASRNADAAPEDSSGAGATETAPLAGLPEKIVPTDPPANAVSQINETGRLFIRNLPYLATEDDLRKVFERFGPLSEIHMPISKETKKPKGFAYVLYLLPEHAIKAFKAMDSQFFMGRLMHILPGKEKPLQRTQEDENSGFKSTVKKEREAKRKALAGSDFNWNSMYMSSDAVADSISDRLKISKADLLSANDANSSNPAVRLALAETHIINDTKKFFEDNGVVLERFGGKRRSDTVILVKNIPYNVEEEELRALFGKHGSLGRVLVPPTRTIAIVEFLEPSEARTAFRHLAYKRLKDAPIYLERAPKDIFNTAYDPDAAVQRSDRPAMSGEMRLEASNALKPSHDSTTATAHAPSTYSSSGGGTAGCVLFVKNLNFETTEDSLRTLFGGVDGLSKVTIRRKEDPKTPGRWLSMGFGFVEYQSPEAARQAMSSFQGVEVDDHALVIKLSDRMTKSSSKSAPGEGAKDNKPKGTKIVVKNVPFEATRKDIRDLISTFGQIKSVRLPKKFSGGHRGFAFVEFLTPQEAQHVLDTVKDTHLYGRHLVLDWAEDENSLQAIREKVGRQFAKSEGDQKPNKRSKIEMKRSRNSDDDSDLDMESE